jgi:hypothetical protein
MRGGIEVKLWGKKGEGYTMGCVYLHEMYVWEVIIKVEWR